MDVVVDGVIVGCWLGELSMRHVTVVILFIFPL